MQNSLVSSDFKDFTSDYEQIKERSNEIKQYFLQRFSKIPLPKSLSSCKDFNIKQLNPHPLKKNQSHQITPNLSKSKSLISVLRSSSMLGFSQNTKEKKEKEYMTCLGKIGGKRMRKGVSENERWEERKRENIKIKSMEFQTLSQVIRASDSSQLSVNKNNFKQNSSELNFANKSYMTERIKQLKEQQYAVKCSPTKNMLVLKEHQIYRKSTFSLQVPNICETGGRLRMKNKQIYPAQKGISSIQQAYRKYSEPCHLEDEENVNSNEESPCQNINNLQPSTARVKGSARQNKNKSENPLQQSDEVKVTSSHINLLEQSSTNIPIASNSMGAKFPHYPSDKMNRDSNDTDSSKYKRRAISEDKIMSSRFIQRKKELDSNEFENYYLNLIRQVHSDSKGDLSKLKQVFLQNSIQRRVSLGIIRLVQESINKRKSRGASSISLNFNASSQNDHPFEIIHTPERIGENFIDLKSDYCIDYQLSGGDGESGKQTWSSLKGILDESKIKISDYKEFFQKDTERNSLSKSNKSKNQSSYMIDLVRQELKYPSPSKQKRISIIKKDQTSFLQKLSQQLQNPEQSFSSSQTKEEMKEEKPKFLSQEEYQNLARQKYLAPKVVVQGGKKSTIQQEKPLQDFKEEIVQRPDLEKRDDGGQKVEGKIGGLKPQIGKFSAFSAVKKN